MQSCFFNNLVKAYADWFGVKLELEVLYKELGFTKCRFFNRDDLLLSFAFVDQQR